MRIGEGDRMRHLKKWMNKWTRLFQIVVKWSTVLKSKRMKATIGQEGPPSEGPCKLSVELYKHATNKQVWGRWFCKGRVSTRALRWGVWGAQEVERIPVWLSQVNKGEEHTIRSEPSGAQAGWGPAPWEPVWTGQNGTGDAVGGQARGLNGADRTAIAGLEWPRSGDGTRWEMRDRNPGFGPFSVEVLGMQDEWS